jgi:RNA polymerase-binding transcription factor DksA
MDADLPTPDRVDLDPYEVDDEVIALDDEIITADPAASLAEGDSTQAADERESTEADEPPDDAADDRLDLDAIESDLAGVEVALARLSDGTYWTDEATGEPLPDELLASSPTARHA